MWAFSSIFFLIAAVINDHQHMNITLCGSCNNEHIDPFTRPLSSTLPQTPLHLPTTSYLLPPPLTFSFSVIRVDPLVIHVHDKHSVIVKEISFMTITLCDVCGVCGVRVCVCVCVCVCVWSVYVCDVCVCVCACVCVCVCTVCVYMCVKCV